MGQKRTQGRALRVVVDTNVIVSAVIFKSNVCVQIVDLWMAKKIKPLVCAETLDEYARALSYEKFKYDPTQIARAMKEKILPFVELAQPSAIKVPHPPSDPDDEIFLKLALGGKADALVSGDKALLALNGKYKFRIVSPGDFMRSRT